MTPTSSETERLSMVLVLGTVLGGAVLMAGSAMVLLMMMTHF
jgi:hypothetical protein